MPTADEAIITAPAVVERPVRPRPPRRHRLEEDPPPPIRAYSVDQIEAEHPGTKGRMRTWIKRADAGDPEFAWLKFCVIRVARSVLIDDVRFRDSLHQRTAIPAAPSRRSVSAQKSARAGKKGKAVQNEMRRRSDPARRT
jgi:hypothetical protein